MGASEALMSSLQDLLETCSTFGLMETGAIGIVSANPLTNLRLSKTKGQLRKTISKIM